MLLKDQEERYSARELKELIGSFEELKHNEPISYYVEEN